MTKKRKPKIKMKMVRIDHRTHIQVPWNVNDEVARQVYLEKLDHSRTDFNRKSGHHKKGRVDDK